MAIRQNIQNVYPLTPLQEGMLFHALLDSTADAYFQQTIWEIEGPLDPEAFVAAWEFLVQRHDILRTVFSHLGTDRPLQVVLRERKPSIQSDDFSSLDPIAQKVALEEAVLEDRATPFDLTRGPLMRVRLSHLGNERWQVLWSHHHILLDGWSVGIVLADWAAIYAALRLRERPVLAPPAPWNHYIRWQEGHDTTASAAYWSDYVGGFKVATPLPALCAHPAEDDGRRGDLTFDLGVDAREGLARWSARHGTTVNVALQTLWAILVSRHCASEDILFGSVVSGRSPEVEGIEGMVGNFVNTVPVRLNVSAKASFAELIAAAQKDQLQSASHHFHSLSRIQAASPLRSTLIGTLFAYENYPLDARLSAPGASSTGFQILSARTVERTHYPLAIQFLPSESLHLRIIFRPDLHPASQIRHLVEHFKVLLGAALLDDSQLVGDIDILSLEELRERIEGPNRSIAARSSESVLQKIETQIAAHPDRLAVEGRGMKLTYRGLGNLALGLARRLRTEHRIGVDDPVALLAGHDVAAVLGMVACLKAGAAYAPLDPNAPPARLCGMIERLGCRVVLADRDSAHLARTLTSLPVIEIETEVRTSASSLDLPPPRLSDLAYVIHTSGSTGEPKGVAIEHGALANLVVALGELLYDRLAPSPKRIAVIASFAFDASVKQIFCALCGGHTLVIAEDEVRRDPKALSAWLSGRRIAVSDGTPSLFAALAGAIGPEGFGPDLRHLLLGGEPLPGALVSALKRVSPNLEILNVYGPTECCVDATSHVCTEGSVGIQPLGRPILNQRIYVLDEAGRPAPLGAPGEIVIGGLGVARGYLGRPDLTAERFLSDPFLPGGRVYRSGDRGRWRDDNTLEFLGRVDGQVKLRGYRIEIGEIEACLAEHPAVAAGVVLIEQGGEGAVLTACILPQGIMPTAQDLRRNLSRDLPDYMIPTLWRLLATLPTTLNGKIDRDRLAASLESLPLLPRGLPHAAPRSEVERCLVAQWEKLLEVEGIGIHDNYFTLGGDSIKAITLVSRLQREGFNLALKDLFAHPTIAELAPRLAPLKAPSEAVTISSDASVGLTPIQAQLVAGRDGVPRRFNQTLLLSARERLNPTILERALSRVLDHHEALRLIVEQTQTGWRQRVGKAPPLPLPLIDLRAERDEAAALTVHADRLQDTLDPASGRLVAAALYRRRDGDRLLLVIHHWAVDAVSWRILLEDLRTAYDGETGRIAALPPASNYLAWSKTLATHIHADGFKEERDYWKRIAEAELPAFPVEFPEGLNLESEATQLKVFLDPVPSLQLIGIANQIFRTTPEELLLTALLRAFDRWGGLGRLRIGLEGHGRGLTLPGIDPGRTVGWFTALYPVLLDLPVERDLGYQIRSIKEQCRQTPGDGQGFGALGFLPLVLLPVRFNYLGQIERAVSAGGFAWDDTSTGEPVDGTLTRRHELDLSAMVIDGRLVLGVRYGARRFGREGMQQLIALWADEIARIIAYLAEAATPQLTPSDLTYSEIGLDELESILS